MRAAIAAALIAACAPGGEKPPLRTGQLDAPAVAPVVTAACNGVDVGLPSLATLGADAIRVERSIDAVTWETVATLTFGDGLTVPGRPDQTLYVRYFAQAAGAESGPSPVGSATPIGPPDRPTNVIALPGSGRATVTWQLPASAHGAPFTQEILARPLDSGDVVQFPVDAAATRAVVGPLNGDPQAQWIFAAGAANRCGSALSGRSNAIELAPWNSTAQLPIGLFGIGAAAVRGTAYLVGGLAGDFTTVGFTLRATPDPLDGRLPRWSQSGDLHVHRANVALAAGDGVLYAIGGREDGPANDETELPLSAAVETGRIRDNGTVEWSLAPSLPAPRGATAAVVHGRFLYVVGGVIPDPANDAELIASDVLVAHLDADGAIASCGSPWQVAGATPPVDPYPLGRAAAAVAAVGDFLFVFGGMARGDDLATVHRTRFLPDGTLDPVWVRLPDLPVPTAGATAVIDAFHVYLLGAGAVLEASIQPDDAGEPMPGQWHTLPAPDGRVAAAAFGIGPYLYAAGGLDATLEPVADARFAHLSEDGSIGP